MAMFSASAAVVDLGGETVSKDGSGFKTAYEGNTIENGTVTLTGAMDTNTGTYTIGSNAVVQCAEMQYLNGGFSINIVDGGEYKQTASTFVLPFRYGNVSLTMDGGKFTSTSTSGAVDGGGVVNFGYVWNNKDQSKNAELSTTVVIDNSSALSISTGNLQISGAKSKGSDSRTVKSTKTDFAVTNSSIVIENGSIVCGANYSQWISNQDASYVKAIFGPGSDLTLLQIYALPYPAPSVVFDGATIHYAGTGSNSFIGQNSGVSGDIYELQSGGITVDIPSGMTLTIDGNSSAIKGEGGITKTGDGALVWNRITSSGSGMHLFTGPLVVSNGTWTSSIGYAASAFRADGGTLVLSGTLSASDVELAATEGGTLTLTGADITDADPSLTLAGGGTTDYFTQDAVVASYSIGTLTLGPGAVLDLDADATGMDTISASSTNITATAESPITVNMNFSAVPSTGQTFAFFEVESADVISINAKVGDIPVLYEKSVVGGRLVMTVSADDYTWNGTQTNWGDTGAWTKDDAAATWSDGNYAIFATANSEATLAADVVASKVSFTADATIGGTAALTAYEVSVDSGVSATISAATSNALIKTGAGTLTFGSSRTEQTTVTEGTLAVSNGATLDPSKLTIGTDSEKSAALDYGGQTFTSDPTAYLGAGMDVALTNGTFSYSSEIKFVDTSFPAVLTVANGATLLSGNRFNWNTTTNTAVNVAGGTIKSTANNNNWFMQASYEGRLYVSVTDGGLAEFGGETYMLTCRDGSDDYNSPELHLALADSTLRVANGKSIRFGCDSSTKPSATPVFTLAATNSVFDIGYGMYIGNDKTGLATAGSYTADFESCVITGRYVSVYADRTLNNALFNGSTIVFNNTGAIEAADSDSKWFTVGDNGLTLDTNGNDASLNANLGGSGAVTKIGSGTLTIATNQTLTSALNVNVGTVAVAGGVSVERATTVANGAVLTVDGTEQATVGTLSLESGSTLNVGTYTTGIVPLAVTTLTLPDSGTATLTVDGGALSVGTYKILEKTGITAADVQDKLVPSTGSESYSYSVSDDTLILAVGTPTHGRWMASVGSGDFSDPYCWEDWQVPVAGDALDFSGVTSSITISCGDLSASEFGAVTMGDGVITFNGSLTATNFTDTSKISVDTNSTVTMLGDLLFDSGAYSYIVYKVDEGGKFVVTGKVIADYTPVYPTVVDGTGHIVVGGIKIMCDGEVSGKEGHVFAATDKQQAHWVIGPDGLSGDRIYGVWALANSSNSACFQPNTNDFTVALDTCIRSSFGYFEFNTTGFGDEEGHVIQLDGTFSDNGAMYITGTGTALCNYTPAAFRGKAAYSGTITVSDSATLAINADKYPTTGAITICSNAVLQVAESAASSGTAAVALGGDLTLKNGAALKFNFTKRDASPVLDLTGKTVAFEEGESTNITVTVTSADGIWPMKTSKQLTSGYDFTGVAIETPEDCPEWLLGLSLDESGNIIADIKPIGFRLILQ